MNVPESVQAIEKLSKEMQDAANTAQHSSARYEAHLQLYNVACMQGDPKEIEAQRLNVISQVESLLDAGYELYSRRRMIHEIQRNVTD
jgi:hypothetical protein